MDALILFEACLHGRLNHVPRRPHDRERQELITSGNIFIYEEHASGIKRWTDGVSWSPSRILGNFLIYRELEKPFPPGEKKRALKKKKVSQGINKTDSRPSSTLSSVMDPSSISKDPERSLVGSLVDSYPFKSHGLVKKTISITFQGVPHHLVSYYNIDDVLKGTLITPSECAAFSDVQPRAELVMSQNFRNPLDEVTTYSQDERGFMTANAQPFYGLGAPVADFTTHPAVITQAMAVSSMPVGQPMPAYTTSLEYDFLQVQPPPQHHHHQFPHHQQLQQQQPRHLQQDEQQSQYHQQRPPQQPQPQQQHGNPFIPTTPWSYDTSAPDGYFFG
ncbi:gti1 pac2 family [Trichoderma arundinaceum]|uniref:Gti1 pac2 family n=1 Tax=Trichoderma arundinaceum TaxID=490622 RepID=A0A395NTA7_TRIAR|nr:gti1 pac2 family [Trichoderma arundinaceum]